MDSGSENLGNDHLRLGPTGKFPKGKISEHDDGGLKVAIGVDKNHNRIIIDFGTKVSWIGFSAEEAEMLAISLLLNIKKMKE